MTKLDQVRDLYKMFREQTPSSPAWFQVIDQCVDILMQDYIGELEERSPLIGLDDDD